MTRINLVDPTLLSDAHLGAEYRELPRIYGLVRQAIERGETLHTLEQPAKYTLGTGHVRFFYSRLGWLNRRFEALVEERRRRGQAVNYPDPPVHGIPEDWFGEWEPSPDEIEANVKRINERGGLRRRVSTTEAN